MAYSQDFIFGRASYKGRLGRAKTGVGELGQFGHEGVVVVVETAHHAYEELDADSVEHGERLAREWVAHFGAISASVQIVRPDGSLKFVALVAPDHAAE